MPQNQAIQEIKKLKHEIRGEGPAACTPCFNTPPVSWNPKSVAIHTRQAFDGLPIQTHQCTVDVQPFRWLTSWQRWLACLPCHSWRQCWCCLCCGTCQCAMLCHACMYLLHGGDTALPAPPSELVVPCCWSRGSRGSRLTEAAGPESTWGASSTAVKGPGSAGTAQRQASGSTRDS